MTVFRPTRRDVLRTALAAPLWTAFGRSEGEIPPPIDREALVRRHNVVLTSADIQSPLQVGNGELAFTADITGLQTFMDAYERGMPLGTLSQWGWHSFPNERQLDLDDIYTPYEAHGRQVLYADGKGGYATDAPPHTPHPAVYRRVNPHRMHLGRIAVAFDSESGHDLALSDVTDIRQELDLWTGVLESRFRIEGLPVTVVTVCHPEMDLLSVAVESPLVGGGRLGVSIAFPYPAGEWGRMTDWSSPGHHFTSFSQNGELARFDRQLDETRYVVVVRATGYGRPAEPHRFEWRASGRDALELSVLFVPEVGHVEVPGFDGTLGAARRHWRRFWTTGGAIDLSESRDDRAPELERRIVLSQYLTAVNCAGRLPPQETGLATNSWYGKFHLEMHWWHAAHFALWGRPELLERSLHWYQQPHVLEQARENARRQGYQGVRWPKQVAPDGRDSPSPIAVFLIWQQPHLIFYAELLYRTRQNRATLERYADLVEETATFMASYAAWDAGSGRFVLGPPLVPAQESYGSIRERVVNPTFELAYWWLGVSTAQAWRERLGRPRHAEWDRVIAHLSRPTVRDGVYAAIEVDPFTIRNDHPSMLAALGMLPPTPLIDADIMRRTLHDVRREWDWESTWGWDYPVMAMTAARVGEPQLAVDALLMEAPKNRYLPNGHNYQDARLPLYLPGNGGLLYAAAMMAAGWDGAPDLAAPGFPRDGSWRVRGEGLARAL